MATVERKTRGRQKVPMVRMEKQSNRLVTFSKRRAGLFKKASELCTLCGAKAAVVVFSPGRKPFSFGHPSVEAIINRYLSSGPRPKRAGQQPEPLEDVSLARANQQLSLLNDRIDYERKKTEEFLKERKAKGGDVWWLAPAEELSLSPAHMRQVLSPMIQLRDRVCQLSQRWAREGIDARAMTFSGLANPMNPSGYPFQSSMAGEGRGLYGGQPPVLMVSNPIQRNPNENPPMVMIPTPMVRFQDNPSFTMGLNGSGLAPASPFPSMPNPMGGFDAPNVASFQGANNPIGGQFTYPVPYNMDMNPTAMPPNPESFMNAPNGPFNPQGGFGFGSGFY